MLRLPILYRYNSLLITILISIIVLLTQILYVES